MTSEAEHEEETSYKKVLREHDKGDVIDWEDLKQEFSREAAKQYRKLPEEYKRLVGIASVHS